jgi:hypothetical protein
LLSDSLSHSPEVITVLSNFQVQSRIKSAFAKRDELIKELRDKSAAASARADHLEALLIKQREQLLQPKPK